MTPDRTTLDALRIDRTNVKPPQHRGWLIGGLLVLLGGGAAAAWFFTRPEVVPVRTAVVRETTSGGQRVLLNSSGYVTARREATVSSKVTGKVTEVLIEEGMIVEAGQVLARIDSSNVQASLRLAEAQLEALRASLDETRVRLQEAQRNWGRISRLASEKIAAVSDLDTAEAEVKSLEARLTKQVADVTVAEREVSLWQQQLEDTIVRAPFSGVVVAKNAQPGEMISPMSAGGGFTRTGICTIVDMSSLEIEVDVNESYINRVEAGQRVEATLDSYPDWKIAAKVIAVIPTADRQKATVKVRVGFDQLDPRILPDMGVKVAFHGARDDAGAGDGGADGSSRQAILSVPTAAIRQDAGRDIVWVVRDGMAERRAVTTSGTREDQTIVSAGLRAGEKVIVDAPAKMAEGTFIRELTP